MSANKRKITFEKSTGDQSDFKEEKYFDKEVSDDEIRREYENWVWEQIGNSFSWYDSE